MSTALLWFRQDLRLADNPALQAALAGHEKLIALYIHDPYAHAPWQAGAAARWWLHHSLQALEQTLRQQGNALLIRQGDSHAVLSELCAKGAVDAVYWNRRYEPNSIALDKQIKGMLQQAGVPVHSFNASLLFEPWQVLKGDGQPYKIFTPFWKCCLREGLQRPLIAPPQQLPTAPDLVSESLDSLRLLPSHHWADNFTQHWQPGEDGAHLALARFCQQGLAHYAEGRDRPDQVYTSRLSPHLHLGEISPARLVHTLLALPTSPGLERHRESWIRELGWREFAHYLLYHFPHTPEAPFDERFSGFRWEEDPQGLTAWQTGQTGIPIVDAGMRELWHTGWMHNRVRMIAASLLSKNLLLPWQAGARWFWDTLVDADLAANTLGWQWTAGCGADAAPWFRIFNPVLQGQKFDPHGEYVRRWIPELAALPNKTLHQPWLMDSQQLSALGIVLGRDYPAPIVDLGWSRQRALDRFAEIK